MPKGADINFSIYVNLSVNYNVTVYYYPQQHSNHNSLFGYYFHLQKKDY